MTSTASNARLVDIELDESIGRSTPDVEHERAVAIFDLIEENTFRPVNDDGEGPYRLKLSLADSRLVFAVARENEYTVEEVDLAIHAHPTLSEAIAEAALDSMGRVIHI